MRCMNHDLRVQLKSMVKGKQTGTLNIRIHLCILAWKNDPTTRISVDCKVCLIRLVMVNQMQVSLCSVFDEPSVVLSVSLSLFLLFRMRAKTCFSFLPPSTTPAS